MSLVASHIRHATAIARLSPERQRALLGQRRQAAPWESGTSAASRRAEVHPDVPESDRWIRGLTVQAQALWSELLDVAPTRKVPSQTELLGSVCGGSTTEAYRALETAGLIEIKRSPAGRMSGLVFVRGYPGLEMFCSVEAARAALMAECEPLAEEPRPNNRIPADLPDYVIEELRQPADAPLPNWALRVWQALVARAETRKLPTMHELCALATVSQNQARGGIAVLEARGWVGCNRGRHGTLSSVALGREFTGIVLHVARDAAEKELRG